MKFIIFFIIFFKFLPAFAEIPIIVISPSKTEQSLSSVGSSIDVLDNKTLLQSSENFIGNILDFQINGSNFSRQGGVGNGIRFGSLNDYYYDVNLQNKENLKPEKSTSLDFGIDKKFDFLNLTSSLTFFYNKYDNNISNWASNLDNGNSYVIKNSSGKIESKGVEFSNKQRTIKG